MDTHETIQNHEKVNVRSSRLLWETTTVCGEISRNLNMQKGVRGSLGFMNSLKSASHHIALGINY